MLSVKVLIMVYLNSAANPVVYYTRRVSVMIHRQFFEKHFADLV